MVEEFLGHWVPESEENLEGFMKGINAPEEHIAKAKAAKVNVDWTKDGDTINVTRHFSSGAMTNHFKLGEESTLHTIMGKDIKVTVTLEDGHLVGKGEHGVIRLEISGGKMKETITVNDHTMSRVYAKK